MAHMDLGVDETQFPGINGPMRSGPETAKPLNELAEVLLRGPHTLACGQRVRPAQQHLGQLVERLGRLRPGSHRSVDTGELGLVNAQVHVCHSGRRSWSTEVSLVSR